MSPEETQIPLASPNLLGRWARFVFQPPPTPKGSAALLHEPTFHRARRETFEWANNHAVAFSAVSVITGAIGVGVAVATFGVGFVALIAGGMMGLVIGLFAFFAYEAVYKTPRRKLALANSRIAELVEAAEGSQGLSGQEILAFQQLVDTSQTLEEHWRMSISTASEVSQADSDFAGWCADVLSMFARLQVHPLNYTEFKQLTAMRHERSRYSGSDRLEDAADDIRERREWLIAFMKHLERQKAAEEG